MTKSKNKWSLYEILWLTFSIGIATLIKFKTKNQIFTKGIFNFVLDYTVLVAGVFCVILATRGIFWNFLFGIYTSVFYAYISFKNGHYGEAWTFMAISVPMNVASMISWKRNTKNGKVQMKQLSKKKAVISYAVTIFLIYTTGIILKFLKNQTDPFLDASTVTISNLARILKFLRLREQWAAYFFLNIFETIKWTSRLINKSQEAPTILTLKIAYLTNSIYAFWKWSKESKK